MPWMVFVVRKCSLRDRLGGSSGALAKPTRHSRISKGAAISLPEGRLQAGRVDGGREAHRFHRLELGGAGEEEGVCEECRAWNSRPKE